MLRNIILGLLIATNAFAYSGSGGIWAQRVGDFIPTNFKGDSTGFGLARDFCIRRGGGVIQVGPGMENVILTYPSNANLLVLKSFKTGWIADPWIMSTSQSDSMGGLFYEKGTITPFTVNRARLQSYLDRASSTNPIAIFCGLGEVGLDSTIWVHGNTTFTGLGRGLTRFKRTRFTPGDPNDTGHLLISAPWGLHSPNASIDGGFPKDSLANILLKDFTLDGNYSAWPLADPTGTGNFGIQIWHTDGVRILGVEVKNTLQTGIELDACKNSEIRGVNTFETGKQVNLGTRNGININNNSGSTTIYERGWARGFVLSDLQIINPRGAAIDFSSVSEIVCNNIYMAMRNDSISNQGPPVQDTPIGFEIEGNYANFYMEDITISNVVGKGFNGRFLTKGGLGQPLYRLKVNNVNWTAGDSSYSGAIALGSSPGGVVDADISNCTFRNLNARDVAGDCSPFCTAAGLYIFADDAPNDSLRDIRFSNITLEYAHPETYNAPNHGVLVGGNARNISFDRVMIYGAQANGFRIVADDGFTARDIYLRDCYVEGSQREAYAITESGVTGNLNNIQLLNCEAKDSNKNLAGYSFLVSSTGTNSIKNVRIEGSRALATSGTNMRGLQLIQTGSAVIDSISIINNDFDKVPGTLYNVTGTVTNIIRHEITGGQFQLSSPLTLDNNKFLNWKNPSGVVVPVIKADSASTVRVHALTGGNIDFFGSDGSIRTRFYGTGGMSVTGSGAQYQLGGFVVLQDNGNDRYIVPRNASGTLNIRDAANTTNEIIFKPGGAGVFSDSLRANDGIYVGGALVQKIIQGSAALDFDVSAVNCQDLTIPVFGAEVGDQVVLGIPNGSVTTDTIFTAWVSTTNVVTVRACDYGGTADLPSGTFKVTVIKQ